MGSRVAATVAVSGAAYRAAKLDDLRGHAATDADPPRLALSSPNTLRHTVVVGVRNSKRSNNSIDSLV